MDLKCGCQQYFTCITTMISDPCSSNLKNRLIVADMCMSSFATEESHSGGYNIDSVVLRIMIQQDNCICRVTLDNQIQPVSIGLRKYGGLASSAPVKAECGLAVDINHIPNISTGNVIAPIECINNVDIRNMQLLENSTLQFKSKIINGTFTKGYCMQIRRDISSNHSQVLRIDCDAPTEHKTSQTTQSDPTTDTSGNDEYSSMTTSTSTQTTGDTTATAPRTDTSKSVEHLSMTTDLNNAKVKGLGQTTYILIGAGSVVALILLVVLFVVCLRRKSTQKAGIIGNVNKSYQQEECDDQLKDNVLYVPAGEFDITGGNYSTADVDTTRSSNKRLSIEGNYSTVDVDTTNSSNEKYSMEGKYSTVDDDTRKSSNERLRVEGNYSTVDDDTRKSSNERLSMEGIYRTVDDDTQKSSNERLSVEGNYSTVDDDTRKSSNERLSVEGNYSTVDDDTRKSSNERLSVEGNYSTVDDDTRKSSNERLSVEGNYSTVDVDTRKSSNERLSVEGNYSTVDDDTRKSSYERLSMAGNYSTVELDEHLERNCSHSENSKLGQTKGKQKPTIKPKPKSACIKSDDDRSPVQNVKHITPPNGSDNVYAVVDKRSKDVHTTNGGKEEGTGQPDQTYAVVDKARKRKSSQDETNKKKFEINSGNR